MDLYKIMMTIVIIMSIYNAINGFTGKNLDE